MQKFNYNPINTKSKTKTGLTLHDFQTADNFLRESYTKIHTYHP